MSSINFVSGTIIPASWLNEIDATVFDALGGATTASQVKTAIGAASSGANSDITSLVGLTTAISIAQGGTGATTAPAARTALGLAIGTDVQAYDVDTVKSDVSQTFTLPQYGTKSTDNDLSFDIGAGGKLFFDCTPTAGGVLTFTNIPTSPCWVTIKLVNGSNYAITAHANTKVTSTFLSTISATGAYIISGYCDGTNVHCATAGASA